MNAYSAALENAKARFLIGWPLLIIAIALYAPADGITRLVLLAAGTLLATRTVPGHPAPTKAGTPAQKKPTPARKGGEPR